MRPMLLLSVLLASGLAACTTLDADEQSATMQFTGPVTAVDNACFADGVCTATVAGVVVTTMSGERLGPPVWGQPNNLPQVGQTVQVHCARTSPTSCTLKGSTAYFLRPVD